MEIMKEKRKEKRKENKEEGNAGLIMNKYGNTLPPIKLEKKTELHERVSGQDQINPQKKVKSKPLPNNNDLKELEPLNDPVKIIKKQQVNPLKFKNQKEEPRSPVQNNFVETRRGSYKPYSLKEYRKKEVGSKTHRMGGLGANIGSEEWEKQNSKLQVMKQFSSRVKVSNKITLESMPKKRREPVKEVSKLEKALEFAKNVPKPKPAMPKNPKVIKEKKSIEQLKDNFIHGLDSVPDEPKQSELEELNQKHENFVNEVNEIKKLFM
ncbi:unnamed protein product [Moneuplotes crassus]|uniref:Uncharacterized protein n=1 Tax=Euplotes crassus TaxID=5936 RepID=A0AAD1X952_EUPCR|nr:unnamed protein product [Moneuplotes crassus]